MSTATATALDRLRESLEAHGSRIISNGNARKLKAQYPAHEDRDPSLSVTDARGRALVHCHAGCDTRDVLATLNLTVADLFDSGRVVHRSPDKRFRQANCSRGRPTVWGLERMHAQMPITDPESRREHARRMRAVQSTPEWHIRKLAEAELLTEADLAALARILLHQSQRHRQPMTRPDAPAAFQAAP